jgi:hypothetical protein
MSNLNALRVKSAPAGKYGDGRGLYLVVKPSGARSWVLRVQNQGSREEIGLGSDTDLTLAEAREKAAHLRKIAFPDRRLSEELTAKGSGKFDLKGLLAGMTFADPPVEPRLTIATLSKTQILFGHEIVRNQSSVSSTGSSVSNAAMTGVVLGSG